MIDKIIREPVLAINLVKAVLVLLVAFGVPVTVGQQDAIVNLVVSLLAIGAIFAVGAAAERAVVTPIAAPRVPSGSDVEVYAPGEPDKTYTLE